MGLSDKKILITGGTGFIGSAIANKLINQDCNVSIISLPEELKWRIKNHEKCKFFNIDIRDFSQVKKCISKIHPEIIFHLAAYVNPERDLKTINHAYSVNFNGTKNLVLSLLNYDYDILINTGTCEEYGNIKAPFKEIDREKPVSPYSASKIAATYFCEMVADIYNKPIITVRPFLTYGPKQIARLLIPWLIYAGLNKQKLSLTSCEQTRDFIYIEDVIDAYIKLAENYEKTKSMGIFNIGSGNETKILDIVKLIESMIEKTNYLIGDQQYRQGETMHFFSSIKKIKKTIKWEPKWDIKKGINETLQWWQNNREIWIKFQNIYQ